MKKFRRISPGTILILAFAMCIVIPLSARAAFIDELALALANKKAESYGFYVDALEHLSDGNREAAVTDFEQAMDAINDALFLINQALLNGQIDSKTAKSFKNPFSKDFRSLEKAKKVLVDFKKGQEKILGEMKKANQSLGKNDVAVNKAAAKLTTGIVILAESPPSAGFRNPGDVVNFVVTGLPADCSGVNVSINSSAVGFTPVQGISGDPCSGQFSVTMGPDQGGAMVVLEVNGKKHIRSLYNYGNKPGGKTTTADFQGCYIGEASGSVTVNIPDEGSVTVPVSASISYCLDETGKGVVNTTYDAGEFSGEAAGPIKLTSAGVASIKVGGTIGVPGASVTWIGSFLLARDGAVTGSGPWSIKIPGFGGGGGTWSIRR